MAEQSSAMDSSSGVVRMWVRIPARPVVAFVSLSKTLSHNCFVLRMGRKAVSPVCCVMHIKEPRTLFVKEKGGLAPVFLDLRLEHPARWIMCALQIFCIIIIIINNNNNNNRGVCLSVCQEMALLRTGTEKHGGSYLVIRMKYFLMIV